MIHTIAPVGHTGSFSWSLAHNKFSQQSSEWFDSIRMAKTPKFGDLPFTHLMITFTTMNIINFCVEKKTSSAVSLVLDGLRCFTLEVQVGQAMFFSVWLGARISRTPLQILRHENVT
jgi:hypothetical protein